MRPRIDRTEFGSITIEGEVIEYDVIVRLNGKVKKRKKKLSKAVYGTSHTISLDEAKHVYQKGTEELIIGADRGSPTFADRTPAGKMKFELSFCVCPLLDPHVSLMRVVVPWSAFAVSP
jgi:hypothetical protein